MNHEIYLRVKEAINNHDLHCTCYTCEAFTNAENGSKGHAAACLAVAEHMYPSLPTMEEKS